MEFRKAYIWAAQFEVMKVFVFKKKKKWVKTASHSALYLRLVIIALGRTQGAQHRLENLMGLFHGIRYRIPFLRATAWVGKDAAAHHGHGDKVR